MSIFVFDDSLKVGITEIDEQHGRFIGFGYPDYAAHKAVHNDIAADLFEFDIRLLADDPAESRAFVEFLSRWLQNHIRVTDRQLAAYLRDHGVS